MTMQHFVFPRTLALAFAWISVALGVPAVGCVGLDKPSLVAACENSPAGCSDNTGSGGAKPTGGTGGSPGGDVTTSQGQEVGAPADVRVLSDLSDDSHGSAVPDTGPGPGDDGPGTTTNKDALGADVTGPSNPDAGPDAWIDTKEVNTTPPDLASGDTYIPNPDTYVAPDVFIGTDTYIAQPDAGPGSTVTFSNGRGQGAMTGYGWVMLGASDSVSTPTCGSTNAPITSASPCLNATQWNSPTALCTTGSIPALSTSSPDYVNNWGIQVGVNATDPDKAIGKSFGSITVNATGLPSSGARVELHRFGDAAGATYCANLVSGTPIVLTSFNTVCWDPNNGTALTAADVAKIDKVGIQVSSITTAIAVTSLCMTSIVFGQ